MEHKKGTLILVDNTAGVLSRVSGLFSRRGYNIDSLTVDPADPDIPGMTVVANDDDQVLDQIRKQLNKLVDAVDIKELKEDHPYAGSWCLSSVRCNAKRPVRAVISIADIFRAKIVGCIRCEPLDCRMTVLPEQAGRVYTALDVRDTELARTGIVTRLVKRPEDVRYL